MRETLAPALPHKGRGENTMTKVQRGAVLRAATAFDGLRSGTMTATTTAAPLSTDHIGVMEVVVQNAPGGQISIFVGDRRYQYYELTSGSNVRIGVCDLSLVYVRAESGSVVVNWLAPE